jgi:hypothetical protein
MRKSLRYGLAIAAIVGLSGLALAEEPAKPAPQGQGQMMQGHMKGGMMMPRDHGAAMARHRHNCFDAAWQSDEWKRCEAMMGRQPTKN